MSSFTSRRNHNIIGLFIYFIAVILLPGCTARTAMVEQSARPVCIALPQSRPTSRTSESCQEDWEQVHERFTVEAAERSLSRWKANPETEFVPEATDINPRLDVAGEWILRDVLIEGEWEPREDMFSETTFLICRARGGSLNAEFYSSGCFSRLRLQRTATFAEGVLQLDHPVSMYYGLPFEKLYAVRCDGSDCLIAASDKKFVTRFGRRPMPAPGI